MSNIFLSEIGNDVKSGRRRELKDCFILVPYAVALIPFCYYICTFTNYCTLCQNSFMPYYSLKIFSRDCEMITYLYHNLLA